MVSILDGMKQVWVVWETGFVVLMLNSQPNDACGLGKMLFNPVASAAAGVV